MKNLLLLSFLLLLNYNITEAQTNAGIPDASTVLVVYRVPVDESDTLSRAIKDYYQNARGIPESNIVPLQLPRREISIGDWSDPHVVKLGYNDEYIQDSTWAVWDSTHCVDTAKFHAYQYFLEEVVDPIRLHLQQNNLTSTIRYIVMCRGIPYKIQAAGDYSIPGNINVDGLLCMLNTDNYDDFVQAIFNQFTTQQCFYNSCDTIRCYGEVVIENPYFDKDPNFEMNARFLPDYYVRSWGGYNYKLSYLVSRIDGLSFDIIKNIIDKSVVVDQSGEKIWVLDGGGPGTSDIDKTYSKLDDLDFVTQYNNDKNNWITEITPGNRVIGYTSAGIHQGMPITYIQSLLNFEFANGAVFNTYESFNGYSIGTLRRAGQGLMTEFLLTGGTGGAGHSWEPFEGNVIDTDIYFPSYAVGYNLIDASYLALQNLAWRNVFVGDPLTKIYNYEIKTLTADSTITSGDIYGRIVVPEGKTLTVANGSTINFKRNSSLRVYGKLKINGGANLTFNSLSELRVLENGIITSDAGTLLSFIEKSFCNILGTLTLNPASQFIYNSQNVLTVEGRLYLKNGSTISLNDAQTQIKGKIKAEGVSTDNVNINFFGSNKLLNCINSDSVNLNYTNFNGGALNIDIDNSGSKSISVSNSNFVNSQIIGIALKVKYPIEDEVNATIKDCFISEFRDAGIKVYGLNNVSILNNTFESSYSNTYAILCENNENTLIDNCTINSNNGIGLKHFTTEESAQNFSEVILITNCDITPHTEIGTPGSGIYTNNYNDRIDTLKINSCLIDGMTDGIVLESFDYLMPTINNNAITNYLNNGMNFLNGLGVIITNNQINSIKPTATTGLYLCNIANPIVLDNEITLESSTIYAGAGIQMISSNGSIRRNLISGHLYGIELGGSSPDLAQNIITGNRSYGLYVSSYSSPNLSRRVISEEIYPLTGYNSIYENGVCSLSEISSEIYIYRSSINLESGCNTIADDRYPPVLNCDHTMLIDGEGLLSNINAQKNYWGNHPIWANDPGMRFGEEISIDYEGYLDEPCIYTENGSLFLIRNSNTTFVDSIYSSGAINENLSEIEIQYSNADQLFYSNLLPEAKVIYNTIAQDYVTDINSSIAFNRLYQIEHSMLDSSNNFQPFYEYLQSKINLIQDSVLLGAVRHLSDLSLIAANQINSAIQNFELIIQENPNTDLALYNEINALTASRLIYDSTLQKGLLAKYNTKNNVEYFDKVKFLLNKRNNGEYNNNDRRIPESYALYQNYPNPFNPITTIKFDLPVDGLVQLEVYDILGRRIAILINENKVAGSYEHNLSATTLASGVYIYKLRAGDFIQAKKMVLLK